MARVIIEVPDGTHCANCCYLNGLEVRELNLHSDGLVFKTKPFLAGTCILFNREVTGNGIDTIEKCSECLKFE